MPSSPPSVLIVEDHPRLGALFRRMLLAWGFEQVEHVVTARAALTVMRTRPAEVVVLDVRLRRDDLFAHGFDAGEQLERTFRGVRVGYITGSTVEDLTQDFPRVPRRPILVKPFGIGELVEFIYRAAGREPPKASA